MYRAMTLKVLRQKINIHDAQAVEALAQRTTIWLKRHNGELKIFLDGEDVTEEIRKPDVTRAVSVVSSYKKVREALVRQQRQMGKKGGIVLEGRDIGTVVFPEAQLKIYMVANVEERARRRQRELQVKGIRTDLETLVQEILERDEKDAGRLVSPMKKADDAVVLDTSNMTIEQQVEFITERAKRIIQKK